ncbi:MAG: FecR domain-containing protein [Steroidobacteraceae bacterium]
MTPPSGKLGDLIRDAGRRQAPDAAMLERLHVSTHAAWQAQLAARRRRYRFLATAASLLLVTAGALLLNRYRTAEPALAVARVSSEAPAAGRLLHAGEEVQAGASGLVLVRVPETGTSLRLAAGTRLRWRAAGDVELLSGQVYVDTGHGSTTPALQIEAGPVSITHVGTQFVAQHLTHGVQVLVRDGLVRMSRGSEVVQLARGEAATASFDPGMAIEQKPAASSGAEWEWVDALAPPLRVEGRDLRSVLQEMAYQAGFVIRFDEAGTETRAAVTVLHGPAIELPPPEALRAVLATAGLRVLPASTGDEILIGPR